MPPPYVTTEEAEEELIICLHLPLSGTSLEQRSSASSAIRSLTEPPSETGSPPPIVSTDERPSPSASSVGPFVPLDPAQFGRRVLPRAPADLDVGLQQRRRGPAKEDIVGVLDEAIGRNPRPLGGIIGGLSRGLGNLLFGTGIDPRAGVSLSQQLAELTDSSIGEVHIRLLLPFIGEAGLGRDFARALGDDFRRMARAGDVEGLEGIETLLEGTEARIQGIIKSQTQPAAVVGDLGAGVSPGSKAFTGAGRGLLVLRSGRALKAVTALKRQAELMRLLAERVQEAP